MREWLQEAIDAGPLELPDQDFVVQLAYVLSHDPARVEEARALLARVLAIDPLHSDACELRARLELERPGGDLAQAERDLRLAGYALHRHRAMSSRMRDPFYWRVEVVKRTDPRRALELCKEWTPWPGQTEEQQGNRRKQREALREELEAALGEPSGRAAEEGRGATGSDPLAGEGGGGSSGEQLVEPDGLEPAGR